jgi:hypothetical protein
MAPRGAIFSRLIPTVPDDDSLSSSWPDLFRPSTSLMLFGFQDVDARDKRGHDESITQGRWYQCPLCDFFIAASWSGLALPWWIDFQVS